MAKIKPVYTDNEEFNLMKKEKRALTLYLILVFAISAPIETIWIMNGAESAGSSALLMVIPAIVAIILKLVYFRKKPILGLGFGRPIYYLYATVIPLVYIGLSYFLYWIFVPNTFVGAGNLLESISSAVPIQNIPIAVIAVCAVTVVTNIPLTLGEELGWRGLMYPLMQKLWGRNNALIISGVIWAVWHIPPMIGGVYNAGAPILYQIPVFIIHILAATVVVSWLRVKSNSVWPAVLWHTLHNFLDQLVFRSMTNAANSAYFVSETGFITTAFVVLFAVLILIFGKFNKVDI